MQIIKRIGLTVGITCWCLSNVRAANETQVVPNKKVSLPTIVPDNAAVQVGFQLTAKVEATDMKPDMPVVLHLTLKNVADRSLRTSFMNFGRDLKLEIKNERNEPIHLTRYGEMLQNQEYVSRASFKIMSGQESKSRITISRLYDLTASGAYTVTATTYAPKLIGSGSVELRSNSVNFTILRDDSYYRSDDPPHIFYPPGTQPPPSNPTPPLATNPVSTWKISDAWQLSVDFYTTAPQPKPGGTRAETGPAADQADTPPVHVAHYGVKVKVWGEDDVDGTDCWAVRFIPDQEALAVVQGEEYGLWVGKQDGLIHRIVGLRGRFNPPLSNLAGIPFVTGAVFGYPLEMLPLVKQPLDFKSPDGYTQFALQFTPTDAGAVLQAQLKLGGKDRFLVRQTWPKGAQWWSDYEKQDYNQHLILKAKLLNAE